jgi:hypothetical protein
MEPEPQGAAGGAGLEGRTGLLDSTEGASTTQVRQTPSWPGSWGIFQPFIAVFSEECMGQLASFGPA